MPKQFDQELYIILRETLLSTSVTSHISIFFCMALYKTVWRLVKNEIFFKRNQKQ